MIISEEYVSHKISELGLRVRQNGRTDCQQATNVHAPAQLSVAPGLSISAVKGCPRNGNELEPCVCAQEKPIGIEQVTARPKEIFPLLLAHAR